MNAIPHLAILAAVFSIVLGVPFGFYALLTTAQRRTTRDIRVAASAHGWKYRRLHWQGNPTAFRIEGHTAAGLPWIMSSEAAASSDRNWSAKLHLRFPTLAGEEDFAIEPRAPNSPQPLSLGPATPPGTESRIAPFSEVLAREIGFHRGAQELPSGDPAFDHAYRVLVLPQRIPHPLIDPPLAGRILHWPAAAIPLHSILAWRNPYGLHLQARLLAPPNWPCVSHLLALAQDLLPRVPPPLTSPPPRTLIDRIVARFLQP